MSHCIILKPRSNFEAELLWCSVSILFCVEEVREEFVYAALQGCSTAHLLTPPLPSLWLYISKNTAGCPLGFDVGPTCLWFLHLRSKGTELLCWKINGKYLGLGKLFAIRCLSHTVQAFHKCFGIGTVVLNVQLGILISISNL